MMVQVGDKYVCLPDENSYKSDFRLEKIVVLDCDFHEVDIDLSIDEKKSNDESLSNFSLLIGVNGVGKSSILRGIIDFFIDFQEYSNSFSKSYRKNNNEFVQVVGVKYKVDDTVYDIWRYDSKKIFTVNDSDVFDRNMPIPNIVASCFGVFDKFPIKNTMSSSTNRYNVPFYTYVGARASSNTFSVVSSIFQMLYYLLSLEKTETILRVRDLLTYMGYEDRLVLTCLLRKRDEIKCLDDMIHAVEQSSSVVNSRRRWYIDNFISKDKKAKLNLYLTYKQLQQRADYTRKLCRYDFEFNQYHVQTHKDEIKNLYQLRQLGLITQTSCYFYKKGKKIDCVDISSGELNMFCTVIGALSATEKENALILIDEPEISQHPNWQMSIIDFLNEGLKDSPCHLVIATHSHFLVSDLPRCQSTVTYLNKTNEGLVAERIKEDTYGWSAEEVLLKVFKVPTTRNIYLAKIVGDMLDRIAKGDIDYQEVASKVQFLEEVLKNMSEVDPMKKIITTIVNTFKHEK